MIHPKNIILKTYAEELRSSSDSTFDIGYIADVVLCV